jgi:hypothetical protein
LLLLINVRDDGEWRSKYLYGSLYLPDLLSLWLSFRTNDLFGLRDERFCFLQPLHRLVVEGTLRLLLLLRLLPHLTDGHLIPFHELFLLADSLPDPLLHLECLLYLRVLPVDESSIRALELRELLSEGAVWVGEPLVEVCLPRLQEGEEREEGGAGMGGGEGWEGVVWGRVVRCLEGVGLGGEKVEEEVRVRVLWWLVYREVDGLERWLREDNGLFLLEWVLSLVLIAIILSPLLISVASLVLPPSPAPLRILSRVIQSSPPVLLPHVLSQTLSPSILFLVTTAVEGPRVVLIPASLKRVI